MVLRHAKKGIKRGIVALIMRYSNSLGAYLSPQALERLPFGKHLLNWLIQIHANNSFFASIHPIYFAKDSTVGDRLQQP